MRATEGIKISILAFVIAGNAKNMLTKKYNQLETALSLSRIVFSTGQMHWLRSFYSPDEPFNLVVQSQLPEVVFGSSIGDL
jgi:hypothetical protein